MTLNRLDTIAILAAHRGGEKSYIAKYKTLT